MLAILECFSDYEVIGSTLKDDGHWYPNTGSIKIQLENLIESKIRLIPGGTTLGMKKVGGAGIKRTDALWEMMFKITVPRLIKFLNPLKVVEELKGIILPTEETSDAVISTNEGYKALLTKIQEWLPGNEKLIGKLVELYADKSLKMQDKITYKIQNTK